MAVRCPKCSFEQESGTECLRCGVIFDRATRSPRPPLDVSRPVVVEKPAPVHPLKAIYRTIRWTILAGTVLVILMIVRQDTPPVIDSDTQARESMELKLRELGKESEAGRPHSLRLNEAEVNTWLTSNLALANDGDGTVEESTSAEEVQSNVREIKIDLLHSLTT